MTRLTLWFSFWLMLVPTSEVASAAGDRPQSILVLNESAMVVHDESEWDGDGLGYLPVDYRKPSRPDLGVGWRRWRLGIWISPPGHGDKA